MATEWANIRIRKATLLALREFMGTLVTAHDQGQIILPQIHDKIVTADDAIRILLEREERKRERARKSRSAKRQPIPQPE